ncbi:hypothetical protein PJP07_30405, partial [Mycobacterium kansasii]
TAIQKLRDNDYMRVEELVGLLQTYELNFKAPKRKSIALKSSKHISQDNNISDSENLEDDMDLLAKKFYKIFKSKKKVDFQKPFELF